MPSSKIVSTTPKPVFSGTYWEIQPPQGYYIKGRNLSLPWGKWFEASGNHHKPEVASPRSPGFKDLWAQQRPRRPALWPQNAAPGLGSMFSNMAVVVTDPRTHGIPFWGR